MNLIPFKKPSRNKKLDKKFGVMDTLKLKELFESGKISKSIVSYLLNTHQINTTEYLVIIWND